MVIHPSQMKPKILLDSTPVAQGVDNKEVTKTWFSYPVNFNWEYIEEIFVPHMHWTNPKST